MKVAILTCSTGQGHNSAAHAVRLALEARGAACSTVDALAFLGDNVSEAITGAFVEYCRKNTGPSCSFLSMPRASSFDRISESPRCILQTRLYADNLRRYHGGG
jgi:hypothetical protein